MAENTSDLNTETEENLPRKRIRKPKRLSSDEETDDEGDRFKRPPKITVKALGKYQ